MVDFISTHEDEIKKFGMLGGYDARYVCVSLPPLFVCLFVYRQNFVLYVL